MLKKDGCSMKKKKKKKKKKKRMKEEDEEWMNLNRFLLQGNGGKNLFNHFILYMCFLNINCF